MSHSLLQDNQNKRLTLSSFKLICFAFFNAWQMGFIYFIGASLSINGRTPLPINMDNVTTIIALAYVLCIIYMFLFPKRVVWAERITLLFSLFTAIGFFLPLSDALLRYLVYAHVFFCCFMIGFESFIIANYFSEETAIKHLTLAYGVSLIFVALFQNDILPFTFSSFRIAIIVMIVLLLIFAFSLPASASCCINYVKKGDTLAPPKRMVIGILILVTVCCFLMLAGPASVEEIKNGVCISYLSDAVACLGLYFLYRKYNIHPLKMLSILITLGAIGFLGLYLSTFVSQLTYISCIFLGFGYVACGFLPLYSLILIKSYPSKYIIPIVFIIAVITVIIHSSLVDAFREIPEMLYLVYLAINVILSFVYMQLEPYAIYVYNRKNIATETTEAPTNPLLETLTKREKEVLELIGQGYANSDIAKILVISDHTVNDYTKKIYKKLKVHSRHAAAKIINTSK